MQACGHMGHPLDPVDLFKQSDLWKRTEASWQRGPVPSQHQESPSAAANHQRANWRMTQIQLLSCCLLILHALLMAGPMGLGIQKPPGALHHHLQGSMYVAHVSFVAIGRSHLDATHDHADENSLLPDSAEVCSKHTSLSHSRTTEDAKSA